MWQGATMAGTLFSIFTISYRGGFTFLFCFLLVAASKEFWVNAYTPLTVGETCILPQDTIGSTPVWHSNPPTPSTHPGYKVTNVGKTVIRASIYWKDSWPLQSKDIFCDGPFNCTTNSSANVWYELPDPVHIDPLKSAFIRPPVNAIFYYTRLVMVIVAKTQIGSSDLQTAVVNVEYDDGEIDVVSIHKNMRSRRWINFEHDMFIPMPNLTDSDSKSLEYRSELGLASLNRNQSDFLKNVFKWGITKIPPGFNSIGIEPLIQLFWPDNKPSVWDEIRDQVRYLIDLETSATVNVLLGRIMRVKRQLQQLAKVLTTSYYNRDPFDVHFNLAQNLIGLEEEFIIRGHHNAKKLNFDLLPLYSNVVLMKAAYYSLIMRCDNYISETGKKTLVSKYFEDMIRSPDTGSNDYIFRVFKNVIDLPRDREFDRIMTARNRVNQHGYVAIWNNLLDTPLQKMNSDVLIYSNITGKEDAKSVEYALRPPSEPLTPALLSHGKYNVLTKLMIYHSSCTCPNCSRGIKLFFANGATYEFGKTSNVYSVIELTSSNGPWRIHSISVGIADPLKPNLAQGPLNIYVQSDMGVKDVYRFGNCTPQNDDSDSKHVLLYKENHYIASIYASFSSGEPSLLHNIAVSYLPWPTEIYEATKVKWNAWGCSDNVS